jgi:hypothetical protein
VAGGDETTIGTSGGERHALKRSTRREGIRDECRMEETHQLRRSGTRISRMKRITRNEQIIN